MAGDFDKDATNRARSQLEAAAANWLAAQRAAFDLVRDATGIPPGEIELAEGYRWVTRLASLAQNWFVEKSDPFHPQLFQLQDDYRKLLVDNPDVRYLFAVLDDATSYRLVGTRGEAAYVGLTFGTPIGKGPVGGRTGTTTQTDLDKFEIADNGEIEILLAPSSARGGSKAQNWIELLPGTGQLAIRETFFDRRNERPAELRLELVGDPGPSSLGPDVLASNLEMAGLFLQFVAATALGMWTDSAQTVNSFAGTAGGHHVDAQEDEVRTHSDPDMTYHAGRFVLRDGECLVVSIHEPEDRFLYWGLTIANPFMESYDGRYTTISLNNRRAARESDGSWRLVIAPTDPKVANWIDTGGRLEGYMIVRWVSADDPPHPSCEVVSLQKLGETVLTSTDSVRSSGPL